MDRLNAIGILELVREDAFVLADTVIGEVIESLQLGSKIVGVDNGNLGRLLQSLGSHTEDVSVGTNENTDTPIKGPDFSNGLRSVAPESILISLLIDNRYGEVGS